MFEIIHFEIDPHYNKEIIDDMLEKKISILYDDAHYLNDANNGAESLLCLKGHILSEVNNDLYQLFSFTVYLDSTTGKKIDIDKVKANKKLPTMLKILGSILFNNSIVVDD